ncbi:MAG TPA: hypothetical protein VEW45_05845 [Candidatus Dormibacteraeota bacterium]|nr:hypothetical protein [Candidatus Dormibacteraeota bacterium]
MAGSAHGPALLLALAGLVLVLLCAAGVAAGLLFAERLHALLPPVAIDAAAVGGATVALGGAAGLLAAVHLTSALALWRGVRQAAVPAIVLSATMSVVALGWAVAALVSSVSGSGPLVIVLPAGICLVLVAVGYAWAMGVLIGLRRRAQPD